MNTRRVWVAGCGAAALFALSWPGAASADSGLGGYTVTSTAAVIHIEVFEPVIPLPASPQGDFSIGYTSSTADSGPSTRALASYLWPGPVIGDGFDQLTGKPGSMYPVQVNSRYPATTQAPAKNTAQLTDGNGMTTSTDGASTQADVTGLGIAGPDVNVLGGIGSGLGQLSGSKSSTPTPPDVPVPVSSTLAALVTAKGIASDTTVKVSANDVSSTSSAAASDISILHGLIDLSGVKIDSSVSSDGTKSASAGEAVIGGLTIAGQKIGLGDSGLTIGSSAVKLPTIPDSLTSLLKTFGVALSVSPVSKSATGGSGSFTGQGLVVSIDTGPLKTALNGPLSLLINALGPTAATQLAPLIQLAPKIVLNLADASNSVAASPAYTGAAGGGGVTGGGTGTTGTGSIGSGGGGVLPGSGPVVVPGTPGSPGTTGTTPGSSPQSASLNLPGLSAVPKFLIIGALVLAAAIGWVMQAAGGMLLGESRLCRLGLSTGVPDLRKG